MHFLMSALCQASSKIVEQDLALSSHLRKRIRVLDSLESKGVLKSPISPVTKVEYPSLSWVTQTQETPLLNLNS